MHPSTHATPSQGLTLIELLIVLAIVGILSAIAYPGYQHYLLRAHRADAKVNLLQAAQWMEHAATSAGLYPTSTAQAPVLAHLKSQLSTPRYSLHIASADGSSFVLSATPQGSQSKDPCGTLVLNSMGAFDIRQLPAGSTMTAQQCWSR